jgi:hypothetical protein
LRRCALTSPPPEPENARNLTRPSVIAATFRATASASNAGIFRFMAPVLYHGAPPAGSNPESEKM